MVYLAQFSSFNLLDLPRDPPLVDCNQSQCTTVARTVGKLDTVLDTLPFPYAGRRIRKIGRDLSLYAVRPNWPSASILDDSASF
jgi:hypothetical protein